MKLLWFIIGFATCLGIEGLIVLAALLVAKICSAGRYV